MPHLSRVQNHNDTSTSYRDEQVGAHHLASDRFWGRLIASVGDEAIAAEGDERSIASNLHRGFEVVEELYYGLNPSWKASNEEDASRTSNNWHHDSRIQLRGKPPGEPYIGKMEVESAAGSYLDLPYRVPSLDRLLVDLLMAMEIHAFVDQMQPQLKKRLPIPLQWLWGNVLSLLIGGGIAGGIIWAAPESSVAQWVAGIVAALTLLSVAFSLVVFPFSYPAVRRERVKFGGIIAAMQDAYMTLGGSPASIRHINDMVQRGTNAGVVWPAPLMVLIEDIAARRPAI